jgi:hypothetical protein
VASGILAAILYVSYNYLGRLQVFPANGFGSVRVLLLTLLSAFLVSAALAYPIARARWSGTQLMSAIFVTFFGLNAFIPQSELLLTMPGVVTPAMAALLTAHGFLVALVFSFVLVGLMGRLRNAGYMGESSRLQMRWVQWLWRLAVATGLGVTMDLCVRAPTWRAAVPGETPTLFHFVALLLGRSYLLLAIMLPIIKMMRGDRLETALTVAVLLALVAGVAPLLVAGLLVSGEISAHHVLGVGLANFIYGFLVGYLFSRPARR